MRYPEYYDRITALEEMGRLVSVIANSNRDTEMRLEDGLYVTAPKVRKEHLGPPNPE